jgi:hypothetical protein
MELDDLGHLFAELDATHFGGKIVEAGYRVGMRNLRKDGLPELVSMTGRTDRRRWYPSQNGTTTLRSYGLAYPPLTAIGFPLRRVAETLSIDDDDSDGAANYRPRFNIAPTDQHFIVTSEVELRRVQRARWGLVNRQATDNRLPLARACTSWPNLRTGTSRSSKAGSGKIGDDK